jgi:4-hydroxy 2-oxovalerate aldolase
MNKISFLDCTLRDGGYINDWRFGNLAIRSVISRLDAAGLDFIEIGFLDGRCQYDKDRSMFPDIPSVAKTIGNTRPKQAKLVAMIDFGTFDESLLVPAEQSCLYGIRLIFTKDKADAALKYAEKIKTAGYTLFLNLVSTPSYNDQELLDLASKINDVKPSGVSIVDTYGLMFNEDMKSYVLLLDHNLYRDIALGYHSHNNLQMSNANTIEFLNTRFKRPITVDATVLGMGKNAGNACTELILSYANKNEIKKFDITQVLECAYTDIQKFQGSAKWGYKLEFLISAITECSPNWTKQYMGKNTLSIKDICNILTSLPYEKKFLPTLFFPQVSEEIYLDYMDKSVDDTESRAIMNNIVNGREILLICPGRTLQTKKTDIDRYIAENKPIVISVNFALAGVDFIFVSNNLRYSQLLGVYPDLSSKTKIITTSNITPHEIAAPELSFNFKTLYDEIGGDVSAVLILELLLSLGVNKVTFAGFDGFDDKEQSFFDIGYTLAVADYSNENIENQLRRVIETNNTNDVKFITPSRFEELFKRRLG